jgi:hypothetical protein
METVEIPAHAGRLMNAIANMGYDPEVALCDLMDNSVDAGATEISLLIHKEPSETGASDAIHEYAIVDNGCGMDQEALKEAFALGTIRKYPEKSLGKFGIGLKSAGLSLRDTLCVLSKTTAMSHPACAVLRLADITDRYVIQIGDAAGAELDLWHSLRSDGSGTVLFVRDLNENQPAFSPFADYIKRYCSVIYHKFMQRPVAPILFRVNEASLPAVDPLFIEEAEKNGSLSNPEDWDGKTVRLLLEDQPLLLGDGVSCRISATHLVHPPSFGEKRKDVRDAYMIEADPYTGRPRHGFYIYRNDRVIVSAERFHGLIPAAVPAWAFRGRLDFPQEADAILSLDVKKRRCQLPTPARNNLRGMIRNYISKSQAAWEAAGRRVKKQLEDTKEEKANQSIGASPITSLSYAPGVEIGNPAEAAERQRLLKEVGEKSISVIQDTQLTKETLEQKARENVYVVPSRGLKANVMWVPYPATEAGKAETVINEAHSWVSEAYAAGADEPKLVVVLHQLFTILGRAELELRATSLPGVSPSTIGQVLDRFKTRASMIGEDLAGSFRPIFYSWSPVEARKPAEIRRF